jgi:CBS domain containing-hemolysin-like protein
MGIALALILILSTTANMAIRHASRARLAERLERRNQLQLLTNLHTYRYDLLFITSFLRMASALGTVLLVADLHGIGPASSPESGGAIPEVSLQYALIVLTSLIVLTVLGVALPNTWARYGGETFLFYSLSGMLALRPLFLPLTGLHNLFDVLVRRLAGIPAPDEDKQDADQIEREILGVVSEGELTGVVTEEDADMIASVMKFRNKEVSEIMTPRTEIVAIPSSASLAEAKELIATEGHSRIPVFDEKIDDIKGVLYAKDLLLLDQNGHFDPTGTMRKVPFVPESKAISDLLQELREQKVHLAIVLDEYGGTAGLVTIEDILEELVGEIADEYEAPEPDPMQRIDEYTFEVDARVHIDELNEELRIELPEDQEYDTIGGFVFSTLGKIPEQGEELEYENIRLRVIDAEERKINRLRIEVLPDKATA